MKSFKCSKVDEERGKLPNKNSLHLLSIDVTDFTGVS